jgi:hypothetical protein
MEGYSMRSSPAMPMPPTWWLRLCGSSKRHPGIWPPTFSGRMGTVPSSLLSFWNSMDAVRAMAGEDVEQVELHPEDARFLVQSDPAAIHYEIERVRASSETEDDLMTLLQQYLVRESGES